MNEGYGANVTDCSVEIADVTGHSDAQISQEEQVDQEKPARSFLQHLRIPTPRLTSPSSRSNGNDKELTKRKAPRENRPRKATATESVLFWPQKLPEACSQARVMTFGYDSCVSKFFGGAANKSTFYDHAGDLLEALVRKGRMQ